MSNWQTETARHYHQQTKHSYWSVRSSGHRLDWANQPLPFKIYRDLKGIPLPHPQRNTVSTFQALAGPAPRPLSGPLSLPELAYLLYCAGGITKKKQYPGGEIYFRAASCTGALYEIELYVICGPLAGLQAGVYQFSPRDFSLYPLRRGDFRRLLWEAAGQEPSLATAPLIIVSTGTYWRNAWKYQERTYRHFGWDNGTILANLLAAANALGLPARLVLGYVDEAVNQLLDLNTREEVSLSLVALGENLPLPSSSPPVEPLGLETLPLSPQQLDYPLMRKMHESTLLKDADEVLRWREQARLLPAPEEKGEGSLRALSWDPPRELPSRSLVETIQRRGSSRAFRREAVSFRQFSNLLCYAARPLPADFLSPSHLHWNQWFLIANAVQDLRSGSYRLHASSRQLELLREGNFRSEAGSLALGQPLAADASFVVFFLGDLERLLSSLGNRAYRALQLEAGVLGGRLYLAAYAQKLGATGLTFYDDDVSRFFQTELSAVFVTALGKGRRPPLETVG